MLSIGKLVLLLFLTARAHSGDCPDQKKNPLPECQQCNGGELHCSSVNNQILDLDKIFRILRNNRNNPCDERWDNFFLTEATLPKAGLTARVFNDVCFKRFYLRDLSKLNCVSAEAFWGMEQFTEEFNSNEVPFNPPKPKKNNKQDCNLFAALSSLSKLKVVRIWNSEITSIPERAFSGSNGGVHQNLETVDFDGGLVGGQITTIGSKAFQQLLRLKYLDLSHHPIQKVEKHGFSFNSRSDNDIIIKLVDGNINGSAFEDQAFEVNNHKIYLDLSHNQNLGYLREDVFYELLKDTNRAPNRINLTNSFLNDRCKENRWLHEHRIEYKLNDKLINPTVHNKASFWLTDTTKFNQQCYNP